MPGVAGKNTAPEDLAHSPLPHTQYLLVREMPDLAVRTIGRKIQTGVKAHLVKNQTTLKKLRQRLASRAAQ